MTPKNNVVRLRLTEAEREQWAHAAGGKGKLSEWIRAVCNVASAPDLVVTAVPREEPVDARPCARAEGAPKPKGRGGVTTSGTGKQALPSALPVKQPVDAVASDCPRWMHHRPGIYCGTCKLVI